MSAAPSFADFLEAKFALDERSLNAEVRTAFLQSLNGSSQVRCLDVGTGTGATLRRLLAWQLSGSWQVTALDREGALLDVARAKYRAAFRARPAAAAGAAIEVVFACCDFERHRPAERYDAAVAHAFLDLVPLPQTLAHLHDWLQPGGYLYASLNYDGETVLAPPYADPPLEAALLACYDESMERRRVRGLATGGAYCGRRLQALLPRHGFEVLAQGRSDWLLHPILDAYPDGDGTCLEFLLALMLKEGLASGRFSVSALERWHRDRLTLLRGHRLAARVRHLDLLARRRAPDSS
jgi:SAM-dependent methyltransferase